MPFPARTSPMAVTAALRATGGNVNAAARLLGYPDPAVVHRRVRRNPALWPDGVPRCPPGGLRGALRSTTPAWVPCRCCDEFVCTIHGGHVAECTCPPIEAWSTDPYALRPA